jgi:cell division protein FtsB
MKQYTSILESIVAEELIRKTQQEEEQHSFIAYLKEHDQVKKRMVDDLKSKVAYYKHCKDATNPKF